MCKCLGKELVPAAAAAAAVAAAAAAAAALLRVLHTLHKYERKASTETFGCISAAKLDYHTGSPSFQSIYNHMVP